MSISFSQIPQIITLDESPRQSNNSYSNIDTVKMKIPSLHDKFTARLKNEEARIKGNNSKLMQQLEQNKRDFQLEQVKLHKALIKQKKLETYEKNKSMSDGQPKHPKDFRKANKELEVFKERGFLLPTIEEAKVAREQEIRHEKERKVFLKTKAQSSIGQPFLPTASIPTYFDNTHQMKKPEDFIQVTSYYPEASKKIGVAPVKNQIQSLYDIPMNIQENQPDRRSSDRTPYQKNGPQLSQSYLEQQNMKPTSANNLMVFQQQLQQQIEEKSQMKNAKSMNSLASIQKNRQSMSNFSTTDAGSQLKNKQWINAYHQKEIFSRPLYNNLDIKLQGNNAHFRPFKPTKTQGYNFNQYVSLEAGERDSRSANVKKMQNIQELNFENEPFEIKPPKEFKSLVKIDDF